MSNWTIAKSDELYHYGVKGMKWGVRHDRPRSGNFRTSRRPGEKSNNTKRRLTERQKKILKYGAIAVGSALLAYGGYRFYKSGKIDRLKFLTETRGERIPAGTKFNSVSQFIDSDEYLNSRKMIYAFDPNDIWDSMVYKGPFMSYKSKTSYGKEIFEHTFQSVKKMKIAGYEDGLKTFKEMYKDSVFARDVNYYLKDDIRDLLGSDKPKLFSAPKLEVNAANKIKSVDLVNGGLKTDDEFESAYLLFSSRLDYRFPNTPVKKFLNEMTNRYDVMVDPHNYNVYNDAHKPMMILHPEKIKPISQAKEIDSETINRNVDYVKKVLTKHGKNMLI